MHNREIKENCYHCGHRTLKGVGQELRTDFCRAANEECSKVKTCDPAMCIPKKKENYLTDCFITEEPIPEKMSKVDYENRQSDIEDNEKSR
jgi:hypothetical protein